MSSERRSIIDRTLARGLRTVRRVVVAVVGSTILALGVVLIVLPGPAFVVIPVGLAILALEFEWARRLLRRARALAPSSKPAASAASPEGEKRRPGA